MRYRCPVTVPPSETVAWRRIATALRLQILDGALAPGEALPTEPTLMEEYGVSRGTVTKAFDALRHEGLIDSVRGRGTFVRSRPKLVRQSKVWYDRSASPGSPTAHMVTAAGGTSSWDRTSRRDVANAAVATRLGIEAGAPVMRTDYVFRFDGEPFKLSTSWEPLAITGGTPIEEPDADPALVGVVSRFDSIGVQIVTSDEVIWPRPATESEREQLGLALNEWVLHNERTYSTADGTAVETADIVTTRNYRLHYGIPVR